LSDRLAYKLDPNYKSELDSSTLIDVYEFSLSIDMNLFNS